MRALLQGDNKGFLVCKKKMSSSGEQLTRYISLRFSFGTVAKAMTSFVTSRYLGQPFKQFTEFVLNMRFDEEPKYEALMALFEPLLGAAATRPINIERTVVAKARRYLLWLVAGGMYNNVVQMLASAGGPEAQPRGGGARPRAERPCTQEDAHRRDCGAMDHHLQQACPHEAEVWTGGSASSRTRNGQILQASHTVGTTTM